MDYLHNSLGNNNMKVNPIALTAINSSGMNASEFSISKRKESASLVKMHSSRFPDQTVIVKSNQRFIMGLSNSKRIVWDILIAIMCLYQILTIPLLVAFFPDAFSNAGFLAGEVIISIVYFIDILVSFRTTYIDSITLEEVSESMKIVREYLFSFKIIVDILAALPLEFVSPSTISFLRLLKIYKIFKLSNMVSIMKIPQTLKLILKFIILMLFLLVSIHFSACCFYVIISLDDSWIPPEDYPNDSSNFFQQRTSLLYWTSLYHSVFFMVGAKNGGNSIEQFIFFTSFYIIGAIMAAVLLGYMTIIIRNARNEDTNFNETFSTLSTAMKNLRLSSDLRFRITEFFISNYSLLRSSDRYTGFLEILPPSLVKSVNTKLLSKIFQKNPIFFSNKKVLKFAIVRLRNIFYQPGVHVVSQFEDSQSLYFIANGVCNVEVFDEEKIIHQVGQMFEGDNFGEIGLLYNIECTATVITASYTNLAVMDKNNFEQMLDIYPSVTNVLLEKIANYKDNWRVFVKNMIRKVPYLTKLDPLAISDLMYSMTQQRYEAGDVIFTESLSTDYMYFIVEGKVELYTHVFDILAADMVSYEKSFIMHSRRSKRTNNTNGKIRVSLCTLPMGSCIFPKLFLSQGEVLVCGQALSHVQLLLFSKPILEKLLISDSSFATRVEKFTEGLRYFDNIRNEELPKMMAIDTIRNHKYGPGISKNVWNAQIKFRNMVLKIVAIKRRTRVKNKGWTKRLVNKLKALNYAESVGKYHLAKQIANDEISEDAVKVMNLLDDSELSNDLLRQFALRANDTSMVCDFLSGRLKSCRKKIRRLQKDYEEVEKLGAGIEKLMIEAVKISSAPL